MLYLANAKEKTNSAGHPAPKQNIKNPDHSKFIPVYWFNHNPKN